MAKYVGKIFEVNNAALGLRGNKTHKVHVQWYNPFKRIFRCKVITTLEDKTKDLSSLRDSRRTNTYITKRGEEFYLFDKGKYERLRKGEIVPIPMSKTEGFVLWSGYEHTRNLRLKTLKDSQHIKNCKIRRK